MGAGRAERAIKGMDLFLFVADPTDMTLQVVVGGLLRVIIYWAF